MNEIKGSVNALYDEKVDKVEGKGLSTNDFTNDLKSKLDGIEDGAEVNVQSDWNIIDNTNDGFIKNKPTSISGGMTVYNDYTDNGNGTIIVNSLTASLFNNTTFIGIPKEYVLPQTNISLTNNSTNYVVADYNNGSPVIRNTTNVLEINESNIIPILTIYRNDNFLHTIDWDSLGKGLANKLHQSIVRTQRYRRQSGAVISEYGTRNIAITNGLFYIGANQVAINDANSVDDNMFLYYHSSGTWTNSTITQYNNTQYDNGTNLVTISNNKYGVNWVFRGIESQNHIYIVLGRGDYTLSEAQNSSVPSIPDAISSHATLVGKIIVQKDSNTAYSVQSAFDTTFTGAGITNHNDLSNRDVAGNHAKLIPISDSTTAIQITKADGTTPCFVVDTTNNQVKADAFASGSDDVVRLKNTLTGATLSLYDDTTTDLTKTVLLQVYGNDNSEWLRLDKVRGLTLWQDSGAGANITLKGSLDSKIISNDDDELKITHSGIDAITIDSSLNTTIHNPLILESGIIKPDANSTTAIQVNKADGSTVVGNFDTTNSVFSVYNGSSNVQITGNYLGLVNGSLISSLSNTNLQYDGSDVFNYTDSLFTIYPQTKLNNVLEYADNSSAISGGLSAGDVYRTGDLLKIVH